MEGYPDRGFQPHVFYHILPDFAILFQLVTGSVSVHVVEGDHDSFIHDVGGEKVAMLLNTQLKTGGIAA